MIANQIEVPSLQDSGTIACTAVVVGESAVGEDQRALSAEMTAREGMATSNDGAADIGSEDSREVIVLDISPMEEDGAELIRQIQQSSQMPIIVLSAGKTNHLKLVDENGQAEGSPQLENQARLRIVRCRMVGGAMTNTGSVFQVGDLRIDLVRRFVTVRGEPVRLSRNEFRLLSAFVRNAGKTLTGRQLLDEAFGAETKKTEHYLRMYIMLLRRRIERNAGKPRYILTDRNRGYRLAAPEALSVMKRPA
jgi:two-component system KDP operon response regulator KdpE